MNINVNSPEQAKKLIIEVLQAKFKNVKLKSIDLVDVANEIWDKLSSLNENINRFDVRKAVTKIRPDHKSDGHAIMTEQNSAKGDDQSNRNWQKQKAELNMKGLEERK